MTLTVTKTWSASPYDAGLGVNTPLGTGFLRKVSCSSSTGETENITAADLGATAILAVISVIPKSTNSVFIGTVTNAVIPTTTSGAHDFEVIALVRGL